MLSCGHFNAHNVITASYSQRFLNYCQNVILNSLPAVLNVELDNSCFMVSFYNQVESSWNVRKLSATLCWLEVS